MGTGENDKPKMTIKIKKSGQMLLKKKEDTPSEPKAVPAEKTKEPEAQPATTQTPKDPEADKKSSDVSDLPLKKVGDLHGGVAERSKDIGKKDKKKQKKH